MSGARLSAIATLLALTACSDKPASNHTRADSDADVSRSGDVSVDAARDATAPDVGSDVARDVEMPPPTYVLDRGQPDTTTLGNLRGRRWARGIIHAHSVNSHDACDGDPREPDGSPDEDCLSDFRDAVCQTRQDYIFLTEHEESLVFVPWDELLLFRDGDTVVTDDLGRAVANEVACDNGHRALLIPGGELGIMPIGMPEHLPGTTAELDAMYAEQTPARVQSFRDLGAVVLQAHAERRNLDELRAQNLDGFEVYQLHANVAPDIRQEWLGLDGDDWIPATVPFVQGTGGAVDLVFLTFVQPNPPSLGHFDALVAEGQHLTGTGGTDCHQNVFNIRAADGERFDSYRRMMRWFSNYVLVDDIGVDSVKAAVREGRLAIVFEILGTPQGADLRVESAIGEVGMGESARTADSPTIVVERPQVLGWPDVPVRIELLHIQSSGAVVVAEGSDRVEFTPTEPGAYRAVVHITPTHLGPHLGEAQKMLAEREYEWIWFNPVYVDP